MENGNGCQAFGTLSVDMFKLYLASQSETGRHRNIYINFNVI